jgi:NAD(P)-dependent dehydrogenase (short-subunit alcohol dehydrogenase family)
MKLTGKVVVVTGASRGIGKGVALVLGSQGATVYVTGRTQAPGENLYPGTIHETAEAITAAGGTGIAVACDHAHDDEVKALFERVTSGQGHLDILVNNVTTLAPDITNPPPFWTKSLRLANIIVVGLRSAYVSSYYAAPLLIQSKKALIVNISYYGAVSYHLDPAYGATKAGLDKMTWDMAQDFKPYKVAVVSVWPGLSTTEQVVSTIARCAHGALFSILGRLRWWEVFQERGPKGNRGPLQQQPHAQRSQPMAQGWNGAVALLHGLIGCQAGLMEHNLLARQGL